MIQHRLGRQIVKAPTPDLEMILKKLPMVVEGEKGVLVGKISRPSEVELGAIRMKFG